jgi:hypothetical protein
MKRGWSLPPGKLLGCLIKLKREEFKVNPYIEKHSHHVEQQKGRSITSLNNSRIAGEDINKDLDTQYHS